MTDLVLESPRITSVKTSINLKEAPANMYEFFLNGYTEDNIRKLIDNLRMSFDLWDKAYNMYRTSRAIDEIRYDDVSVLFTDVLGNQFVYSYLKDKIYLYRPEVEPYIDINKGLSISQFLDLARDDFSAFMRTSYGKKYVTEEAIMLEGIKQFFGYGHAYRIFIDGRNAKNSKRYAIDKDMYALIDALDDYKDSVIDKREFSNIINHPNTIVEIYDNHKLGHRDALRRMEVDENALIERRVTSLVDIMNSEGMTPDLDTVYRDYIKCKSFKAMVKAAKPRLDAYLKKNPLIKAAYVLKYDDFDDFLTLEQIYNLPLLCISEYSNYSYVATFDLAKFKRAFMASINTRFQKFNNSDIVDKFLSHIDYLLDMFESCDSYHIWHFYGTMRPLTEEEVRNNCKGLCAIRATTYPAMKDTVFSAPPPEPQSANYLRNVHNVLYEYMTGYPFDVLESDMLKYNLDVELGNMREVSEKKNFTDKEIDELIQSNIDEDMMDEWLTEASLEATMYYVAMERDLGRKISHAVKGGIETVSKGVDRAKRAADTVVGPIMAKAKDVINAYQKDEEEDTREAVITDSSFVKLRNFFKQTALPTILTYYALGPAMAIVAFIAKQATKTSEDKTRDAVVRELEMELKLTREKIEDARRKDDDKAKYELMRLESNIENNIAKIKYGHN
jgi:hypothetical protein